MQQCKYCTHYKKIYMPAIKKHTLGCELDKRNAGCKGDFEFKEDTYERETKERGN